MPDDIQKLDLSSAADQIRDKIKLAYVDAIPEEQWKAMIKAELKKFTTATTTYGGYDNRTATNHPAEFEVMAQAELKKHMAAQLSERIEGTDYIPDGKTFEALIVKWMDDNHANLMEDIFKNMLVGFTAAIVQGAQAATHTQVLETMTNLPGIRDPDNPGYDTRGNFIG